MSINDFAAKVTKTEGLRQSISIAQVKEVLKIINRMTSGMLYKIIALLP